MDLTHAEFNRTLQDLQEACGLCPDAIKITVFRDIAEKRGYRADPLSGGHTGKIHTVHYDTGSGLPLLVASHPMTDHATYYANMKNVARVLYGNQFA